MQKTKAKLIVGDQRTIEFDVWSKVFAKAAKLVDRHISFWPGDDPFAYNETASVALLAAAGAMAGHMTLAECTTEKFATDEADPSKLTKRRRHGRADLWLHTARKHWAFEFKQRLSVGVSRSNGRLNSWMMQAEKCAREVIQKSDGSAVAGLIVSLYFIDEDDLAEKASLEIEKFAHSHAAYCWELSPPHGRSTYFLLNPI